MPSRWRSGAAAPPTSEGSPTIPQNGSVESASLTPETPIRQAVPRLAWDRGGILAVSLVAIAAGAMSAVLFAMKAGTPIWVMAPSFCLTASR